MNVETIELEVERVKLLCIRVSGPISDAEYARWLDRYYEIHVAAQEKGLRLAILYDLSNAPALNAQQRRLQSEWNERVDALLRTVTLGVAFVIKSAVIRGVMTAIFWFKPTRGAPHYVCSESEDALDWLLQRCEDSGQLVRGATRSLARERMLSSKLAG